MNLGSCCFVSKTYYFLTFSLPARRWIFESLFSSSSGIKTHTVFPISLQPENIYKQNLQISIFYYFHIPYGSLY